MTATHIETCAACGGQVNVLNPQQTILGPDGLYRHRTAYCNPQPETARERAHRLWKLSQPQTD